MGPVPASSHGIASLDRTLRADEIDLENALGYLSILEHGALEAAEILEKLNRQR